MSREQQKTKDKINIHQNEAKKEATRAAQLHVLHTHNYVNQCDSDGALGLKALYHDVNTTPVLNVLLNFDY